MEPHRFTWPGRALRLGSRELLVTAADPHADDATLRALPRAHAQQLLRMAHATSADVRGQLARFHAQQARSDAGWVPTRAAENDALSWAIAGLEQGRLRMLQQHLDKVQSDFVPRSSVRPAARAPRPKPQEQLSWLEFELLDQHGEPCAGAPYDVTFPDGEIRRGCLNAHGYAFIGGVPPGQYHIAFPSARDERELSSAEFLDIELVASDGTPLPGQPYVATFSDGAKRQGLLDDNGRAYLAPVPAGPFEVVFPGLQGTAAPEKTGDEPVLVDEHGDDNRREPDPLAARWRSDDRQDTSPRACAHDFSKLPEGPPRRVDPSGAACTPARPSAGARRVGSR